MSPRNRRKWMNLRHSPNAAGNAPIPAVTWTTHARRVRSVGYPGVVSSKRSSAATVAG